MWFTAILTKCVSRPIDLIRPAVGLGVLILATFCAPLTKAGVIYTYTGNDFTTAAAPFTTDDSITGSFTVLAAFGDDLSLTFFTPTSFTFSDGVDTVTNVTAISSYFGVATNSLGQISDWVVGINEVTGPLIQTFGPTSGLPYGYADEAANASHTIYAGTLPGDNGSWTESPEPSPFVLTATALLALAFVARKRVAQGIRQSTPLHR
jgi:hypothetical protein